MTGKVIYSLLSADSQLSALVGTRIYPYRRLQEEDLPAVTYNQVTTNPTDTKDGPSVLDTERHTINVWSKTYDNAQNIASRVRTILDRWGGIKEGVVVDSITFLDKSEMFEDWSEVHHIAIDFNFRIKR